MRLLAGFRCGSSSCVRWSRCPAFLVLLATRLACPTNTSHPAVGWKAIRNNLLTPGSMLPTETELGGDMKVSRTVVREALMLLEEDGLIRARRGVGRFVADTLPRIGIERSGCGSPAPPAGSGNRS